MLQLAWMRAPPVSYGHDTTSEQQAPVVQYQPHFNLSDIFNFQLIPPGSDAQSGQNHDFAAQDEDMNMVQHEEDNAIVFNALQILSNPPP